MTGQAVPRLRVPYGVALLFAHAEEFVCKHFTGRLPMATVTGVRLTQRSFRFDGRCSADELGLRPKRCCRQAITEAVRWHREMGHVRALPAT